MSTDPVLRDALARAVPLRAELAPAWEDVLARTTEGARGRWPRRASRRAFAAAIVAAAGLSAGGFALADAVEHGPLHGSKLDVDATTLPGGISTCDLIGKSAGQVSAKLTGSGIGIEWRFTHWGTTTVSVPLSTSLTPAAAAQGYAQTVASAEAVTGGSSDPVSSVPDDSVVWDILPEGQAKAFVFVEAPNDPNAPTVSTDNCSG